VWLGDGESQTRTMMSKEVEGYPHDSGRTKLEGPIMALKVLRHIEEKYGEVGIIELWRDSQ